VVEPLRAEWDAAKAAAVTLDRQGKTKDAAAEVQRFHRRLCEVRVLDPACGSGNFLYVTLEHLKRLEGEVLNALDRLGHEQALLEMAGFSVLPRQLLGIEVNPRAAAIAELVLWIGYIQWHFRTRGRTAPIEEPIIKNFHNIECRDAVLAFDRTEPVLDEQGAPVTRWDGRTMKKHPVTGEDAPDEIARVPLLSYVNPRPAEWPDADFIVGNPPFIGKGRVRDALGDGYVETLREMYPDMPESADFVMYWWHNAALLVRAGKVARFGFITTNSLRQTFNRRVVERHLSGEIAVASGGTRAPSRVSASVAAEACAAPLHLHFAIPDHPWVDSADGAAVRIAMTVAIAGAGDGRLVEVVEEIESGEDAAKVTLTERTGLLHANLAIGANVTSTISLQSNERLASTGLILGNRGFVLTRDEAESFKATNAECIKLISPLRNGEDINGKGRDAYIIDTNGWSEDDLRSRVPEIYQRLRDLVYPERQANRDPKLQKYWWLFRRSNEQVRAAIAGLPRFIATVETSKHRIFTFLAAGTKPEHKLVVFGFDDAFFLGVLSSRIHCTYALAAGGWLGVGNDPVYSKTRCFDPFPFPTATKAQQKRIRDLAEAIDAHRKRQQAQHPKLTLTDCYNVLEKLRAGTPLNAKEQLTHE
ncbi:MAG: DNA methyltransferase, partial [Chthoniobacteraceae bacterium]